MYFLDVSAFPSFLHCFLVERRCGGDGVRETLMLMRLSEHDCPASSPNRFEGGSKMELKAVGKLPAQFDQKINSVYCKSI